MKNKILFLLFGILIILEVVGFASALAVGDRVEVYNTGSSGLLVLSSACGSVIGGKFDGSQGNVLQGPTYCSNYNRYKVQWSDGLIGWSAENWLRKVQVSQICTPYSKRCNGNNVEMCNSAGTGWSGYQSCSYGCSNGQCVNTCTDDCSYSGQKQCNGYYKQTCGNYDSDSCLEWSSSYCSSGCNPYTGDCYIQTCTPKTCSQLGKNCGTWDNGCQQSIDCGSCGSGQTCSNGNCVTNSVTLTLYMYENSFSGAVLSGVRIYGYDSSGKYFDVTTNQNGYVTITGGAGTWSFTASKTGYITDSWTKGVLSSTTHQGYLIKSCSSQCTSGQTRCNGQAVETCRDYNSDGCYEWGGGVSCAYGCTYGQCNNAPAVCTPNSKRCNGNNVEICNSDGSAWIGYQSCSNSYCDNFGNNYCKNNNVYHSRTCYDAGCSNNACFNNLRTDEQLVQTCANGCMNGQCIQSCTPNWQCSSWSSCINGQQTRTCTDYNNCGTETGKPATTQSCTVADPCANKNCNDNNACTTDSCSNGNCINTAITCPSGQTCSNGVCVGGGENSYTINFDVRNMRGFNDGVIDATDILNYIKQRNPNSPMINEANIGQQIINSGKNYNVNPAFLVATAKLEGQFGTAGWALAHPECHNTMGYGIPSGSTPPNFINCVDTWGSMVERVAYNIAYGSYYYNAGKYTVDQIRTTYAGDPNSQSIINIMNDLYDFSNSASLPTCTSDCSYSGQTQCNGYYKQTCGNYDSDSCLEWGGSLYCNYGCSNGQCNNAPPVQVCTPYAKRCNGNIVEVCKSDGSAWILNNYCSSSQRCSNGACVNSCTNDCSYSGQTRCTFSRYKQTCGNYDSDSCLEWGGLIYCSRGCFYNRCY